MKVHFIIRPDRFGEYDLFALRKSRFFLNRLLSPNKRYETAIGTYESMDAAEKEMMKNLETRFYDESGQRITPPQNTRNR